MVVKYIVHVHITAELKAYSLLVNNLDFSIGIADDMKIWGEDANWSNHNMYLTKFFNPQDISLS